MLVQAAQSMLNVSKLYNSFWAEAIATACYLHNLSFTKAQNNTTPYQLWTGIYPNLLHFKIFGCVAYHHIPDKKQKKLNFKSSKCIFSGYDEPIGIKGYKLYDPSSSRVFFNHNVSFSKGNLIHNSSSTISYSLRSVFDSQSFEFYIKPDPPDHSTTNIALGPKLKNKSSLPEFLDSPLASSQPPTSTNPVTPLLNRVFTSSHGKTTLNSDSILGLSPHLK
jgi:hypothetical protein